VHLVRVTERTEPRRPELAEVRIAVLRDYRQTKRDEANRGLIEELRASYRIVVDDAAIKSTAAREALAQADR
jgi:parvulin-like peptidyl-prolyl isomerase